MHFNGLRLKNTLEDERKNRARKRTILVDDRRLKNAFKDEGGGKCILMVEG